MTLRQTGYGPVIASADDCQPMIQLPMIRQPIILTPDGVRHMDKDNPNILHNNLLVLP